MRRDSGKKRQGKTEMSILCYYTSILLYERISNGDKIKMKTKRLKSFVDYRRIRSFFSEIGSVVTERTVLLF